MSNIKTQTKKIITFNKNNISKIFLSPYIEIYILDDNSVKLSQLLFGKKLIVKCNTKDLLILLEKLELGLYFEQFFEDSKKIFKTDEKTKQFVLLMTDNAIVE